MTADEVDLNKIYYFIYSNKKVLAMLVPTGVEDSGFGSKGHFWTKGYFYDTAANEWYYHKANWTVGNYEETDKRLTNEQQYDSIKSLFEKGIRQ